MARPVGPVFVGGFEEFVVEDEKSKYTILYLPDLKNDELQAEGQPQVYYWVPGEVRMARQGDAGDFKFHHTHFVGVMSPETHVGVEEDGEVQGGLLAFTATSRYPTAVLQQAQEQLLDKFRGSNQTYWGWNTRVAPMFRIAPITSNTMVLTNLSPGRNGVSPIEAAGGQGSVSGGSGAGESSGNGSAPPGVRFGGGAPRLAVRPFHDAGPVAHGRSFAPRSNLEAWAFEIQGQGSGSVTGGENAYSVLMGAYPSEILWSGFHGASSQMNVAQNLVLPVWSQEIYLRVDGDWERIFQHFSAHVNARSLWFNADIKAEFNNMRTSGGIEVEMHVDGTIPGGEEMERIIQARSDLVFNTFMQQANQMIFQPADPTVTPAQATSSGGVLGSIFGGGGVALNFRQDRRSLKLHYEETRHHRYNQPTTISSTMQGLFNEMKDDPAAESKYFTRLVLGDLGRKVYRQVKPIVRWRRAQNEFIGDPVAFAAAQIGYPDAEGAIVWQPSVFQSTDSDEQSTDQAVFVRRKADEVRNAPQGWSPDMTFVKRFIHLDESMGATDDPYVKVFVEKNRIEIDEGENGILSNESVIEVRAESTGKLELEISGIDAILEGPSQVVEVEVKPSGQTHDGNPRQAVSFVYKHDDQEKPRILEIYTGQLDYAPDYQYRVHVKIKGTLMTRGMSWSGPWTRGNANGSITVHVPLADEEGVTNVVRFSPRDVMPRFSGSLSGRQDEGSVAPPPDDSYTPPTNGATAPPGRRAEPAGERTVGGFKISPPPSANA